MINILVVIIGVVVCLTVYWVNRIPDYPDNIPCGRYIISDKITNPYKTEYDYVTVLESKDGWVSYVMGKNSTYSLTVKTFLSIYTQLPTEDSP